MYADLSNVVRDIFSIIPHSVGVKFSFSLEGDVIGWRQSKTKGETICEKVGVWLSAQANNRISSGDDPALDITNSENDMEMNNEAEERKWHRMPAVHNVLEMWQGC